MHPVLDQQALVEKILRWLPPDDLCRASAVARNWSEAVAEVTEVDQLQSVPWGAAALKALQGPPFDDDNKCTLWAGHAVRSSGNNSVGDEAAAAATAAVVPALRLSCSRIDEWFEGHQASVGCTEPPQPELVPPIPEEGGCSLSTDVWRQVLEALDSPPLKQGADAVLGFWGRLAACLLCSPTDRGVHDLVGWLWRLSEPGGASIPRYTARELLYCLLLLLHHRAWRAPPAPAAGGAAPIAAAGDLGDRKWHRAKWLQGCIQQQLMVLEGRDLRKTTEHLHSVPAWTDAAMPPPAHLVQRPPPLTAQQTSIVCMALHDQGGAGGGNDGIGGGGAGRVVKVSAFAGTGKTKTLVALVQAHQDKKFLYVSYNSAVAKEVKGEFRNKALYNVTCATTHQLAGEERQKHVGGAGKPSNDFKGPTLRDYKEFLDNNCQQPVGQSRGFPYDVVRCVRDTLGKFMTSNDSELQQQHVVSDALGRLKAETRARYDIVAMARDCWANLSDPSCRPLKASHNTYLKTFALRRPTLTIPKPEDCPNDSDWPQRPYDVLLVDEAQDLNAVTLGLLMDQPGIKVLCGDQHQHIYSFNWCCNAMDERIAPAARCFRLTQSYRLGPEVAALAMRILQHPLMGERATLMGCGYPHASVYALECGAPRTNGLAGNPALGPQGVPGNAGSSVGEGRSCQWTRLELGSTYDFGPFPPTLPCVQALAGGPAAAGLPDLEQMAAAAGGGDALPRVLTIIARTNGKLVELAAAMSLHDGLTFELNMAENRYHNMPEVLLTIKDVYAVWSGTHKQKGVLLIKKCFMGVKDITQLEEEDGAGDSALLSCIKLVKHFGSRVLNMVERIMARLREGKQRGSPARFVLTTAHRSKGCEYDAVLLTDDFAEIHPLLDMAPQAAAMAPAAAAGEALAIAAANAAAVVGLPPPAAPLEVDGVNLLYVAATRAKRMLFVNKDLAALIEARSASRVLQLATAEPGAEVGDGAEVGAGGDGAAAGVAGNGQGSCPQCGRTHDTGEAHGGANLRGALGLRLQCVRPTGATPGERPRAVCTLCVASSIFADLA